MSELRMKILDERVVKTRQGAAFDPAPLCQDSCRMSDTAQRAMISRIPGSVYIQEEGPVGAVGNPEGFPSGSLESRSDFKGPVEDLGTRMETKLESLPKSSTGPSAAAASIGHRRE